MQAERSRDNFIQYGCGLSAPAGWRNFDSSPTLRAQRLPVLGARLHRIGAPFAESAESVDHKSLAAEIRSAGFFGSRRAQFHDNPDPAQAPMEDDNRWIDSLGIECGKP